MRVASGTALSLRGVTKRYRRFVLDRIDLEVDRGTIVGLAGANGSGKSTLFRILMGLVRPDAGEVRVLGLRLPDEQVAAKRRVGFVSEDMKLHAGASLAWHARVVASLNPSWNEERFRTVMGSFRLEAGQKAGELSRGQTLKAMLALALAHGPHLLLLDEPTAGLDTAARADLLAELRRLSREEEMTILFSSHVPGDIGMCADETLRLEQGRLWRDVDAEREGAHR